MKEYYEYTHQDSSVKTISEFFFEDTCPVNQGSINKKQFLLYKGGNGSSNLENIWILYTDEQKSKFSSEYKSLSDTIKQNPDNKASLITKRASVMPVYSSAYDYDLNMGTQLYIPRNKANLEVISAIGEGLYMDQQDLIAFQNEEYRALVNDPKFVKVQDAHIDTNGGSVKYLGLFWRVWIYIKSLDKILDVSPFINSLNTVVGDNGGNFTMSLNDFNSLDDVIISDNGYVSYTNKFSNNKYKESFIHKYVQQNDIVWITFESLENEDRQTKKFSLIRDKSEIPNNIYDMMGFVDISSESFFPKHNSVNIDISGRDFSKILREDGTYFMPFALVNGGKDFFLNYNPDDSVFKRIFDTGEFLSLFTARYRSIRDSLGFIFNQLSTTGLLPKGLDLFSYYRNSLNRATGNNENRISRKINTSATPENQVKESIGVWQVINLLVDNQIDERRLGNGELSHPDGPMYNVVKKICQDPFVEFWGDTMGDKYVFMARQPILTKSQIQNYFKTTNIITIHSDSVESVNLNWTETYYTWYQIQPTQGLFGSDSFVAGSTMPVVYFEEYAENFGLNKLVISDNYLTSNFFDGVKSVDNTNAYRKSLASDMKFVIESNSILPFTRRGNIAINGGDRRIKKGSWVRIEATGEIGLVRSVSQEASSSNNRLGRNTRVALERCMKEEYVLKDTPVEINGSIVDINYFNIVDVDLVARLLTLNLANSSDNSTSNKRLINKDVFNFFLRRRQM